MTSLNTHTDTHTHCSAELFKNLSPNPHSFSSHANTSETFYICNCKTATVTIKLLKSMKIGPGLLWGYYSHIGFHCVLYHVIFFIIHRLTENMRRLSKFAWFFFTKCNMQHCLKTVSCTAGIVCNSTTVTGHVFAINRSMSK